MCLQEAAVAPKQKRRRLQQDEKLPKIPSPHNQVCRHKSRQGDPSHAHHGSETVLC